MRALPILVSLPNSGNRIPNEIADRIILGEEDLFDISDPFTRQIFDLADYVSFWKAAAISPAIINVDFPRSDHPETNKAGAFQYVTEDGLSVYLQGTEPDDWLVEDLLARYFDPYHKALARGVTHRSVLAAFSFKAEDFTESIHTPPETIISLGDGPYGVPPSSKTRSLGDAFSKTFGLTENQVALNQSLRLGHCIEKHGQTGVPWIQVVISKSLYLSKPWFNSRARAVKPERLTELRDKILQTMSLWVEGFNEERCNSGYQIEAL